MGAGVEARRIQVFLFVMLAALTALPGCGGGSSSGDGAAQAGANQDVSAPVEEIVLSQGDTGTPEIVSAPPDRSAALPAGTPPPEGAYAEGTINSYYKPSNAFDRNFNTWWVGETNRGSWEFCYGFSQSTYIEQISINFYAQSYVPGNIEVKISNDGLNWTSLGAMPAGSSNPGIYVKTQIRYFWFSMTGNPGTGYPLIKEIIYTPPDKDVVGATAGPSQDDFLYQAGYAFDGDANKIWAGAKNLDSWDLYYHFGSPQNIQMLTVQFHALNYIPATTTVFVSDDGVDWTDLGPLGPGPNVTPYNMYLFVNRTTNYLRLNMQGTPPSKFPIIKDIWFTVPEGAVSGDSENTFYKAANAFDGVPDTWWVGKSSKTEWNLLYGYAAAQDIASVSINFYSVNHMPAATNLYCRDEGDWTLVGAFPSGAGTTLPVNQNCKQLRFQMSKTSAYPSTGFPLVKDIAVSINSGIACSSDADCDDSDPTTVDVCSNPGTTHSVCRHVADLSGIPYEDIMITFHLRMDGSVPNDAVLFLGDSLVQSLCVAAVTPRGVNYGIGGDTTSGLLNRLMQYESRNRVQKVVLAAGVNDIARSVTTAQIVQNYQMILAQIPGATPVVFSAILPVDESLVSYSSLTNARIAEVNAQAQSLCAARGNCVFVNAGPSLTNASGALAPEHHIGDGIHLNTAGYAIWISALSGAM